MSMQTFNDPLIYVLSVSHRYDGLRISFFFEQREQSVPLFSMTVIIFRIEEHYSAILVLTFSESTEFNVNATTRSSISSPLEPQNRKTEFYIRISNIRTHSRKNG